MALRIIVSFVLASLVFSAAAQSQTAAKVSRITEELSQHLVEGCRDYAKEKSISITIAVVDDRLKLIAYRRMDSVRQGAADLAVKKAESASAWQWPTRLNQDAVAENNLVFVFAPYVATLRGGLPLFTASGEMIGGVGVSGASAEQDEECAQAGVDRAGLLAGEPDR